MQIGVYMKKKILKKVMGVAIAVMLIGSVLAGCQKAADTSGTADSSSTGDIKAVSYTHLMERK